MLKPIWLDDEFSDGAKDPAATAEKIAKHPEFLKAVKAGAAAFAKHDANAKVIGPSAAQKARVAFLDALGQETHG